MAIPSPAYESALRELQGNTLTLPERAQLERYVLRCKAAHNNTKSNNTED